MAGTGASVRSGVIAVTGASRGIGSGVARQLAEAGFKVACLTRKGQGIEDANAADLPTAVADRLVPFACDVTDDGSVREALASSVQAAGPLLGIVNNAGIHADGPSESFETDLFRDLMNTNVAAAFAVARESFPHFKANGGGLIVNMGSYYDRVGIPRHAAYCASKAAIAGVTRVLAVEWAKHNIQCVDLAPGFIATDLNSEYMQHEGFRKYIESRVPMGRPGTVDEIAQVVVTLFEKPNPYLTGSTLYVDGAHGIAI